MRFDILTLFPEMFASVLGASLFKKAVERGVISVRLHDIRDYAEGRHREADDAPFGGGGGMVMKVEPIAKALEALGPKTDGAQVILLTPQGCLFSQEAAFELSRLPRIILLCGHYEGVDERVRQNLVDREISIGDFVLTGGELPALVVLDAVARLVPGFVGNSDSIINDSFAEGLLEGPQYTRPREFEGWEVPEVLLSGHQRRIDEWRKRQSLQRTLERRPDLLDKANLSKEDRRILEDLRLTMKET
ncbi:MAG: tRNA (guanosine(37)-N1)-methyltransferase TrmD [Deltaproteobacteria bacterium]|nr:tRNA (guanosine(37)-N1)-methyltransferase TrmD [Deltaproteobacteria bacterium]